MADDGLVLQQYSRLGEQTESRILETDFVLAIQHLSIQHLFCLRKHVTIMLHANVPCLNVLDMLVKRAT